MSYTARKKGNCDKTTNIERGLIVAAFDFGTTYSGYVYSFQHDPDKVLSPQKWKCGTMNSHKTPTCVLLTSDKVLDSFGYEAQDNYAVIVQEDRHDDYYYFQHFKMLLHTEKHLSRSTMVKDITGKALPALTVFSISLAYLKDHLLNSLLQQGLDFDDKDITYVLTVPAIWTDAAKMFMREAAIKAGLSPLHLILALEPEVASIFCQKVPVGRNIDDQGFSEVQPGTQYIVADLGGGTADFTVHEKEEGGTLKELYPPSGGPWGGSSIDQRYLNFLESLLGAERMERWKKEEMDDYFDLIRDFEIKKRSLGSANTNKTVIKVPVSMGELGKAISKSEYSGKITHQKGKLNFNTAVFFEFFEDTINCIVKHTKFLLEKFPDIKYVLMVGGFADCKLVQERMKAEIDVRLVIPNECELAVLRGAVLFGHHPDVISTRVLRYTYGEARNMRFEEGRHPPERKFIDKKGVERCREAFHKIAIAGTPVPSTGHAIEQLTQPTYDDSNKTSTTYYYSTNPDVVVIDDTCQKLGTVTIYHPPNISGRTAFKERYIFGGTESRVEIQNQENGQMVEFTFDVL